MVNVHEAKTNFSKLLELAHSGQETILAKAGKPYARLMPIAAAALRRTPSRVPEINIAHFFDALPEAELNAWSGA